MLVFIVANFLVIPLAVYAHPHAGPVFKHFVTPGVAGGFNSTSVLLIIAIVGHHRGPVAAVLPAVQHRRQAHHARAGSTTSGSTPSSARSSPSSAASLIVITTAFAFAHTHAAGKFTNAGGVAHGLDRYLGQRHRARSSPSSC